MLGSVLPFWSLDDSNATKVKDIIQIIAFLFGIVWAGYKIREFREFKQKIQFDVDANIYKLEEPITCCLKNYIKNNKDVCFACSNPQEATHVVEVLLKFSNKGKKRFRLYNLQAIISTMPDKIKIRDDDCGLSLKRMHTSGNIVPKSLAPERIPLVAKIKNLILKKQASGFYYIEPGVEQTINYLCIIPKPEYFLQVRGVFSLEQERLFPEHKIGSMKLYPHTAEKTFKLDKECKAIAI